MSKKKIETVYITKVKDGEEEYRNIHDSLEEAVGDYDASDDEGAIEIFQASVKSLGRFKKETVAKKV